MHSGYSVPCLHTYAPKTYWRPKTLPIKAQSQFVINSNHRNHSIWNILCSVSHMLEKPEAQSQFVINSNRHNNSLEIFCATSHIFSVKPQYRSFLMLQSIISTIRFFSMCIFFNFTQSVRRVCKRFSFNINIFLYNNIDLSYVKYNKPL